MTNNKLPEAMQDQIKRTAKHLSGHSPDEDTTPFKKGFYSGYLSGATAWAPWKVKHNELQAQAQCMADALEEIAQSNCDYESTNYARALHMPNCRACKAKEVLQQFKDGKEVGEEPKPEGWPWICEHCGKQDCESDHK